MEDEGHENGARTASRARTSSTPLHLSRKHHPPGGRYAQWALSVKTGKRFDAKTDVLEALTDRVRREKHRRGYKVCKICDTNYRSIYTREREGNGTDTDSYRQERRTSEARCAEGTCVFVSV